LSGELITRHDGPAEGRERASTGGGAATPEKVATRQEVQRPEVAPARVLAGRYRVGPKLGAGGMGDVFEGLDPELSREVAIKFLRLHQGADPTQTRARLVREARALALLSHENVVPVYDVGTADDELYIVMELVRGQSLGDWLKTPRGAEATFDALLAAAHGMAAAHAAGIVHRDFKPDNVVVGDDGRVRVLDFGLAFGDAFSRPASTTGGPAPVLASGEERLTQTGSAMGTPRYMAPEQHAGEVCDARTDVFAFFTVVYEAFANRVLFRGSDYHDLAAAKKRGPGARPPEIPRALWRVICQGLDPDPKLRIASMADAIAALHKLRRGHTRVVLLGGVGLLAVVAAGVTFESTVDGPPCAVDETEIAPVWPGRRSAVEQSLRATDLPFATASLPVLRTALDRYATDWSEASARYCEVSRAGRTAVGELAQHRRCLDRQRSTLDALLESLVSVDDGRAQRAVQAVESLERPEACEVEAASMSPKPELVEEIEDTRDRLAEVRALGRAGHFEVAQTRMQAAEARAEVLDWDPLTAQVLLERGRLETVRGDPTPARVALDRAWDLAAAMGDDPLALKCALARLALEAKHLESAEQADQWIARGAAWLQRAGATDETRAKFAISRSGVLRSSGRYIEAVARAREAVAYAEAVDDSVSLTAQVHNVLGLALNSAGDHDAALQSFELALTARREQLGEDHPVVAAAYNNIGWALLGQDRGDEARRYLEEGVARARRALGDNHPEVAGYITNLAISYDKEGEHGTAQRFHKQALAIREERFGPEHPVVGRGLVDLAASHAMSGEDETARPLYVRAGRIFVDALGPDHPHYALTLAAQAQFAVRRGDAAEAVELYDAALAIYATSLPSDHRFAVESRVFMIGALLAADRGERADALLAEQRALFHPPALAPSSEEAQRVLLADQLWAHGRYSVAMELAKEALAQPRDPDTATSMARKWLDAHPTLPPPDDAAPH